MTNIDKPNRPVCPGCGKYITIRQNGTYFHHRSRKAEYPGSPFKAVCEYSGAAVSAEREDR